MIMGGQTFSAHGDLVQRFLERMDPRNMEVRGHRDIPLSGASDLPPDAPTDEEVRRSWSETVMPDFDVWDGSCGCGEKECAGAC